MKARSFSTIHRFKFIPTAILFTLFIWTLHVGAQRDEQEPSLVNDPKSTQQWIRTELYYGAGRLPVDGKPDKRWENYLNDIVTPRFPEGLTLLEGTGQWRVKPGEKPRRNRTRILILIHKATPEKSNKVDEIIDIWKEISGHQAVLRVTQPADVSM